MLTTRDTTDTTDKKALFMEPLPYPFFVSVVFAIGNADYPTRTAAATTVVQRPFLSPTAVWVTFWVRTISFERR